jgi:hypothetical protein
VENGGYIVANPPYKKDEYIHFISKRNGEVKKVKSKHDSERERPMHNMYEIPFEDIENMNLNNRGEVVPYSHKNVINFSRYMAWYWCPIIGAEACMLYMHLTEYCDDETDICYPKKKDLAEKMNKTLPTINKLLQILEQNNFIVIIRRLNKLANNKETSPIYKLRQTVPLLSKEQYSQLPDILKKKHDEFMVKFGKDVEQDYFQFDFSETITELETKSEKIISRSARKRIEEILNREEELEYLLVKIAHYATLESVKFHTCLMEAGMSKPMFDLTLKDSLSIYYKDNDTVHIIVRSETAKEYLEKELPDYHKQNVRKALTSLYGEPIIDICYFTTKEYIYMLEKGN